MGIKKNIRLILNFFHLDFTKNLSYDRLTKAVMKKVINRSSNCIDVGCHQGDVLKIMLELAPEGTHYAFEPLPSYYKSLQNTFPKVNILPFALAETSGKSSFKFVKNAPAYSGIKERKYKTENPKIQEIEVNKKRLDDVLSSEYTVNFIKIDVEGGEFDVLRGGRKTLEEDRPVVVFESGLGASEYYGTIPEELFTFFIDLNYNLFLLNDFLKDKEPLKLEDFNHIYLTNKEYYFVATPK